MKTNIKTIGAALLAIGFCALSTQVRAQATTSVTTTRGAFTEFVPGSETVVVRSETNPAPLRYVVTKQTTIVDESGTPVAIDQVRAGSPLSVQYTSTGDRLVASRIVVQRAAPVTTVPATTVPITSEQHTSTTTTTTRTLTHDEKEALEHRRHERKERAEEQIEKQKDALDKAKDKLEDDDNDGD